jgi:hypothetical protein
MILQKQPCASAALKFFGVVGVTWNDRTGQNVWPDTLRRAGYSVRSRLSKLAKSEQTVGAARNKLKQIADNEPCIIAFIMRVKGHVLVIDTNGKTVIDTAPRLRDKRRILGLFAIFK